jgi:hypothetical protein
MIKHKFHAISCERDGKRFPSKAERAYYDKLCILKKSGDVIFFLRQVPFDLPGENTYRADFMVFYSDGTVRVVDVKGVETEVFKVKKRLLEETYPFKLEIVK